MPNDWSDLTGLLNGAEFVVERVRVPKTGIALEGEFLPSPLALLPPEDQIFAMAFLKSRGNMRQMEGIFGISYPTVKNRLDRIAEQLDFIEVDERRAGSDVLAQLDRGEISVDEALGLLDDRGTSDDG
jgi:hypothetical protein